VQIQVVEKPFQVLNDESYLVELIIGSGTSCVQTENIRSKIIMPEKVILEGSNITHNSFPADQVDWKKLINVEFHCVPTSGQNELAKIILAGSEQLRTCIFHGYFPLD